METRAIGQAVRMTLPGELRVVEDVPAHFADLVVTNAPASIALSGGETAERCYEALAARPFDWSTVDVYFGDERFVPRDHPDSNEGMVRRALLDGARPRAIHPMYRPEPIEQAADTYDAIVREHPPIEFTHLGLGTDGHTASLFPGSPALDVRDRFVVATDDDLHPQPRLTFTYPAIERCPLVVVTVTGAEKREPLQRLSDGEDLPAARLRAPRLLWLVEEAAAPGS
jgi:6-phosphogluconolactonase